MRIAVRIGIVIFGLLVVLAGWEAARNPAGPPEVAKAQLAVSRHLAQEAVDSLGTANDWSAVTVENADLNAYALILHYTARPDKPEQIEADTRLAVGSVLYQLTLSSHHPSDEQTIITAQALYEGNGQPVILGEAKYDFAKDKVIFDSPK